MNMTDTRMEPGQRFTNRVEDYVRYRPGYPRGVIDVLRGGCGLTADSVVADVGSGTGLLTRLFLENGNVAYGVEPNPAMREAGEQYLKHFARFHSVAGSAEETTLASTSVHLVAVGQAFHWFDVKAAKAEFARVLKPGGCAAIAWNERRKDTSAFLRDYERLLLEFGTDYAKVSETYPTDERIAQFFAPRPFAKKSLPNEQRFDFEGLRGRLLSSSYSPAKGHPSHAAMLAELRRIFDAHAEAGFVLVEYDTRLYYGRL
jgi:SAM-dependent methyltransferase